MGLTRGKAAIERCKSRIEGQFVWQRSMDRPYRIWDALIRLLDGAYKYCEGKNKSYKKDIQNAKAFSRRAMQLPKARRDPEFRVMAEVLYATAVLLEHLLEERGG